MQIRYIPEPGDRVTLNHGYGKGIVIQGATLTDDRFTFIDQRGRAVAAFTGLIVAWICYRTHRELIERLEAGSAALEVWHNIKRREGVWTPTAGVAS